MKFLQQYNEKDIIFFDVETVRAVDKLTPDSHMYDAWIYKSRYNNEMSRKTGEAMTPEEFFEEKAPLYAPFAKIACIVAGRIVDDNCLSLKSYVGDERDLLAEFNQDLKKMAKLSTALCGFNNIGFDQPFVAKRMLVCGLTPHDMLDTAHLKPWEVKHIDLSKLWQGTSFYPDSLLAVSAALGLPSPKQGMDGSQVSEAYYKGKTKEIAEYCTLDVLTTANIFRKFKGGSLLKMKE
jgi:predicted PolB exonuclease-like 3'-5' exonuclease